MPKPKPKLHVRLAALVDARRGERSRAEIAKAAKMSPQQLSQVLLGYRESQVTPTTVARIVKAVGATLEDVGLSVCPTCGSVVTKEILKNHQAGA